MSGRVLHRGAAPDHGECAAASDPPQAFDGEGRLVYGFICLEFSGKGRDSVDGVTASTYVATYDRDGGRYVRTALLARGDAETDHDKINLAVDQSDGTHGGNVYAAWVEISSGEDGDFTSGTILFAGPQPGSRPPSSDASPWRFSISAAAVSRLDTATRT